MANIDDKYCIDKWENSIYDKNNPSGKASLFYPAKTSQANSLYNYWRNGWKGTPPPNSAYAQMPERGAEITTGFAPLAVSQSGVIPNMFVAANSTVLLSIIPSIMPIIPPAIPNIPDSIKKVLYSLKYML